MNLSGFSCAICTTSHHRDNAGSATPWGELVCEACASTFPQCAGCGGTIEPKDVGEQDTNGDDLCVQCVKDHGEDRCDGCELIVSDPSDWADRYQSAGVQVRLCSRCKSRRSYPYWHANRTKVRKHPAVLGSEALDRDAMDHIAREA